MIKTEISFIPELLRKKQYALIIDEMRHRILSTSRFIGFQRDPHAPLEIPDVDLNLNVRPIQKSDYGTLFHFTDQTSRQEIKHRLVGRAWLRSGIKTCYVTEIEEKIPCHLQWMIGPEENNRLSQFTGDGLPRMSDHDIILENAFTIEAYRRRGIEMWTVKQLLAMAVARGAGRVMLFVRDSNMVTRKLVQRLGFVPYSEKTDRRFLFFRKLTFQPISNEGEPSS